jgi:hypothetical protein
MSHYPRYNNNNNNDKENRENVKKEVTTDTKIPKQVGGDEVCTTGEETPPFLYRVSYNL